MFLPFFLFAEIHHFWAWRRWSLNQIPWTPLPCRALAHCTLPNRPLRGKGLLSWSPGSEPAVHLPSCPKNFECHHSTISCPWAPHSLPSHPCWWEQDPAQHLSLLALSLGEGIYPHCISRNFWISNTLICCPSNRDFSVWSPLWRSGLVNVKFTLSLYRGLYPLNIPCQVAHCRFPP